ncbi:MAG TPA: hypothetical protein VN616_05780 [Puia sp.]|nr:hypothetical protein [Puia sp.]
MHYRTSMAFMLLLAVGGNAQSPGSLATLRAITIRLHSMPGVSSRDADLTSPSCFSHFEVLDLRPDSNRIGIHTCVPDFGRNHDRQLVFAHSATVEIAGYLNRRYSRKTAPYKALVVLRTLWLSDAHVPRPEILRHPELRLERTHIRLKAEIYAIRDGRYVPVLRFDTLETAWKKRILDEPSPYVEWGRNLSLLIDRLADSAARLTPEKDDDGRWVDLDEIRQFNADRFDAPIDQTAPARGVYANFEEFRNNTPSIRDFEIKTLDHERLLYIREDGAAYYSHDAWGYCDGKDIFIMRDGILCPAWKEGKAFYLPAGATRSTTGDSLTEGRSRDYRQRSIYYVDMDTGDMY